MRTARRTPRAARWSVAALFIIVIGLAPAWAAVTPPTEPTRILLGFGGDPATAPGPSSRTGGYTSAPAGRRGSKSRAVSLVAVFDNSHARL